MARRTQEDADTEAQAVFHPKCHEHITGCAVHEKGLLASYNGGKLPHALLFCGPRGIGKATFAYRMARFLLTQQESGAGELFGETLPPESLHVPAAHPVFKRVVSGSHPDLLVLEGDDIKIDQTRRVPEFLALTPAEGDWRIVIIDSADAMNRNAANALLKTLEEPPPRSVLILISHSPGLLLPTIRSRCRMVKFPLLQEKEFAEIMAQVMPEMDKAEYGKWAQFSGLSPGTAMALARQGVDVLYAELLERAGAHDTLKLHAFAERFARKDAEKEWQSLKKVFLWLLARITSSAYQQENEVFVGEASKLLALRTAHSPYFWDELWGKAGRLFEDTEHLYLDRKQALITLLGAFRAGK